MQIQAQEVEEEQMFAVTPTAIVSLSPLIISGVLTVIYARLYGIMQTKSYKITQRGRETIRTHREPPIPPSQCRVTTNASLP